jgi:hypothetical protein
MLITHEKHHKTQFLANFGIFRNSWFFSEIFGYFMHLSYQILLFWLKIDIDISNQSVGPLGIKGAVLVLEPTTVECQNIFIDFT